MRSRKWLANSKARFAALQALYQWEQLKDEVTLSDVCAEFIHHRFSIKEYQPIDEDFFSSILNTWEKNQETVDSYISDNLAQNWRLERLASPLRALLRLIVAEAQHIPTPPAVIWTEYQELARAFVDDNDMAFVIKFIGNLLPSNISKPASNKEQELMDE